MARELRIRRGHRRSAPDSGTARFFVTTVVANNAIRIALSGNRLVGLVAATKESIAQLYVRVGHHRLGFGSRLIDWAKDQSGGSLWLYTFARNLGARAFYEKHGFGIIARGFEPKWQLEDIKYEWSTRDVPAVTAYARLSIDI